MRRRDRAGRSRRVARRRTTAPRRRPGPTGSAVNPSARQRAIVASSRSRGRDQELEGDAVGRIFGVASTIVAALAQPRADGVDVDAAREQRGRRREHHAPRARVPAAAGAATSDGAGRGRGGRRHDRGDCAIAPDSTAGAARDRGARRSTCSSTSTPATSASTPASVSRASRAGAARAGSSPCGARASPPRAAPPCPEMPLSEWKLRNSSSSIAGVDRPIAVAALRARAAGGGSPSRCSSHSAK